MLPEGGRYKPVGRFQSIYSAALGALN